MLVVFDRLKFSLARQLSIVCALALVGGALIANWASMSQAVPLFQMYFALSAFLMGTFGALAWFGVIVSVKVPTAAQPSSQVACTVSATVGRMVGPICASSVWSHAASSQGSGQQVTSNAIMVLASIFMLAALSPPVLFKKRVLVDEAAGQLL